MNLKDSFKTHTSLSLQLLGKFKVVEKVVVVENGPIVCLEDCQLVPLRKKVPATSTTDRIAKRQKFETDEAEAPCTICCKKEESKNFEESPETWRGFVETVLQDGSVRLTSSNYRSLPFCSNCYCGIKYLVATVQRIMELKEQVNEMKRKFQNVVRLSNNIYQKEFTEQLPKGVPEEWNFLRKAIVKDMYLGLCTGNGVNRMKSVVEKAKRIQHKHRLKIIVEKPTVPSRDDITDCGGSIPPVLSPAASIPGVSLDYDSENEDANTANTMELASDDKLKTEVGDVSNDKLDDQEEEDTIHLEFFNPGQGNVPVTEETTKTDQTKNKVKKDCPPRIHGNTKGMKNPRSFDKIPPEKLSQTPAAILWRKLRADHPEMSQRELKKLRKELAAQKTRNEVDASKTSTDNTQQIIKYKKGLSYRTSFVHRPPEKLSQTKQAIAHRNLRLRFPEKSQKELKAMIKKQTAERLGYSINGIRCETTEDGRILYKNVEIKKNENGMYSCSICENKKSTFAKRRSSVMVHINRAHMPHTFKCTKCGKAFFNRYELQEHVRQCQRKEKLVCDICGATFNQNPSRLAHIRVVHKGIKPHTCEHCGKTFGTLKDLNIHVRRHTGERPIVCHVCGDSFIEKQSMKKHIRIKHPETAKKTENRVMDETLDKDISVSADQNAST